MIDTQQQQPLIPRHYQDTGIQFAVTPRVKSDPNNLFPDLCRSMITDAPGSGKTLQASEAACHLMPSDSESCAVICPAHLVPQWFDFLCSQYPDDNVVSIEGTEANRNKYANIPARWYIISTQSLRSEKYLKLMQALYIRCHVNVTIIDESHYVKNASAKQSHNVRTLTEPKFCKHVILLSATPIMKEADDLWHQLRIIDPITFRSHEHFLNTYCWFTWTSFGAVNVTLRKGALQSLQDDPKNLWQSSNTRKPIPSEHEGEITALQEIAINDALQMFGGQSFAKEYDHTQHPPYLLGRTYEEIGLELPKLISPPAVVSPLSKARRKAYDDLKYMWYTSVTDDDGKLSINANSAMELMHLLRHITDSPEKQQPLTNYLQDDIGPFLIACYYKKHAHQLAQYIHQAYPGVYEVLVVTGDIPAEERVQHVKDFINTHTHNADGTSITNPNVIVIATMPSITEGCDLSVCSTVYFYEETTTPGSHHQFLSRVRRHRNSTQHQDSGAVEINERDDGTFTLSLPELEIDPNERPIMCRYFHASNTIDERIHQVRYQRAINIKDLIKVELTS